MSRELRRVRKGTKSCTECRRRKVRCTWSSDEAQKCRRCEERDSNCVAQVYSTHSAVSRKPSSRDRIARLEQQVINLNRALRTDPKPSGPGFPLSDTLSTEEAELPDDETSDSTTNSLGSDEFSQEWPGHLSALFENDLISSDSKKNTHELPRSRVVTELRSAARAKLQELIPPKQEVDIIASFASLWLSMFQSLFPAPTTIKTGQEMLAQYDNVRSPTVEPAYLASWLVTLAMTIHQIPKGVLGPEEELRGFRNPDVFSKSVSDTVELAIMRHDALLGTIEGIDTAMLYLRLQLSRGNFKKTWLHLRRVIAVAELIGLHRAARRLESIDRASQEGIIWSTIPANGNARKAQVWESLCSIDRIAGMMFNLPPGTRRYRLPQSVIGYADGKMNPRAYLCSLSEIAMKVQDLDDLDLLRHADADMYANVLKIDSELHTLASVAPASWWNNPGQLSDQVLQYWHYYITIRVHLPFTLRHNTSEQFSFSRLACMKACQTLARRYRLIRGSLPGGFFLCRIVDLQLFTALVVLILAYHAASAMERTNFHAQGSSPPEVLIPETLEFIRSILHDPVSDFARQAVDAVSTLTKLLESDNHNHLTKDITLKVPLLGKIHIRRKKQSPILEQQVQSINLHETKISKDQNSFSEQASSSASGDGFAVDPAPTGTLEDRFPWNDLSWSIEDDQSGVFQDTLMTEDFSPFGLWFDQNGLETMP